MSTLVNNHDTIEKLIYAEGLRIEAIDFHPELDVMLIVLNTGAVLETKISFFKTLAGAKKDRLQQYELIGDGTGVHWPLLDEDLSLKGFLEEELRSVVRSGKQPLFA